jgi:hypothetical protein
MAQFTFTNNTYAGEALAGFMASTLLEADSVKRGLLTVINDVKSRKVILDVDDDVVLQDPSGLFNDQGTTAQQTESYLDPVVYEFMKQEQWDKLAQAWEAQSLKPGAFMDYEGVVDLSDFMVQRYLTKIQIANERLYWLGKSATKEASFTAAFNGLLPTRYYDPTAGTFDVDVLQVNITSIISLSIFCSVSWLMLKVIWPDMRYFFETEFGTAFKSLTSWQKVTTSLFIYCFIVLVLVMLNQAIPAIQSSAIK